MKIGIVGSGNVGGTLGARWARNGHEVFFAVRGEPSAQVREVLSIAKTGTAAEAAAASEVILLATPWEATQEAIASAGDLTGKILIDATNPLLPAFAGFTTPQGSSGGEQVAQWARGAKVVKALNTVGFNIMADPKFEAGTVAMFYCGDDAAARKPLRR
ncbi:MAG: NAD(P)-binding domain-containing protein [Acidobacteriia bacterium]|nr:NAD(P)-binding domain-containing protein [Terriglobia bacterium]